MQKAMQTARLVLADPIGQPPEFTEPLDLTPIEGKTLPNECGKPFPATCGDAPQVMIAPECRFVSGKRPVPRFVFFPLEKRGHRIGIRVS